jgi:hypothetical protein
MRRRQFITLLSGAAAEWPLGASARQPAMPVIGFLSRGSRELDGSRLAAFHQGLDEAGYVEGGKVTMEVSWAENHTDRLPALAADLVRRPVTVIAQPASMLHWRSRWRPQRFRSSSLQLSPCRDWTSRQAEPTGWQPHGSDRLGRRAGAEASGAFA